MYASKHDHFSIWIQDLNLIIVDVLIYQEAHLHHVESVLCSPARLNFAT